MAEKSRRVQAVKRETTRTIRGEFTKKDERAARDFLRERNLLPTFNRFKRIRPIKKKTIIVVQDGISQRLVIHKRKDTVVVRDSFSLRILAVTKRYNLKNIAAAFQQKKDIKIRLRDKKGTKVENALKLKEISRIPLTNVVQVDRSFALRKKVGKLFVNVTFFAKKEKVTVEGGSREMRLLNVEGQKKIAFNQAFQGALSLINFSYETFRINWVHFAYFFEKKRPQPVFQHKEIQVAV